MNDFDKNTNAVMGMYYEYLGYEIIQEAPARVFDDWDRILKVKGELVKVEEKARRGEYDDVLVELIEDLKTGDLGWIYQTKADKLIYSFFDNKGKNPNKIYMFDMETIKNYLFNNIKELIHNSNISPKGYGLTLNVFLPLKLGKLIYIAKGNLDNV
jgi:hypothetical protein